MTRGLRPLPPAALLPLPPLVGVTDLLMGVVGFSSIFLADGVLALDEVPLRGLVTTMEYNCENVGSMLLSKGQRLALCFSYQLLYLIVVVPC